MSNSAISFAGKIAVLSSGPSLNETWKAEYFDNYQTVVASNFAGFLFKHHWFSFWENWLLDVNIDAPRFGKKLKRIEPLTGYIVPRPHETDKPCHVMPMLVGSSSYTSVEVIKFVIKKSVADAEVHLFGLDLHGAIDCLGNGGANRNPQRWQKEIGYLKPLLEDPRVTFHGKRPPGL